MPCDGSHCEPNLREKESKDIAQHLVWLRDTIGIALPTGVVKASTYIYGNTSMLDAWTALLCANCAHMDQDIIYNGRDPKARALADWWDKHQEVDKNRLQKRRNARRKSELIAQALGKLTPEEIEALDMD